MPSNDWMKEMDKMLAIFSQQVTFTLRNIRKCFEKSSNRTFNEDFKKYFLRATNESVASSYTKFEMELSFDVNDILDDGANEGMGFGTLNTLMFGDNTNDLIHNQSTAKNCPCGRASSTVTTVGKYISERIGNTRANIDPLNGFSRNYRGNSSTATADASNNGKDANFSNEYDEEIKFSNRTQLRKGVGPQISGHVVEVIDSSDEKPRIKVEQQEDDDVPIVQVEGKWKAITPIDNANSMVGSIAAFQNMNSAKDRGKTSTQKSSTSIKRFKCQFCAYATDNKSNFTVHMRTHTGEKPHQCDHCFKRFARTRSLFNHMKNHVKDFPFHCPGCHRVFLLKKEKDDHEKCCLIRRYECHICKTYSVHDKHNLIRHMRIHNGEKPFRCEICMKRFVRKAYLETHLNRFHQN